MRLAGAGTSVQISTERALGYVLLPPQMPRGDMPWHRSHSQAPAQAAVNKSPVGTDGPASLLSHPVPVAPTRHTRPHLRGDKRVPTRALASCSGIWSRESWAPTLAPALSLTV